METKLLKKRKLGRRWTECFFSSFRHMLRMRMGEYIGNDGHKSIRRKSKESKKDKKGEAHIECCQITIGKRRRVKKGLETLVNIEKSWKDRVDEASANFIWGKRILWSLAVSSVGHYTLHIEWHTAECTAANSSQLKGRLNFNCSAKEALPTM